MSTLLWKYYFENDVDSFRQVLARANYNASVQSHTKSGKGKSTGNHGVAGSPGAGLSTSPTLFKSMNQSFDQATHKQTNVILSRADVNWRDSYGITLLHHIASSTSEYATDFAIAFLQLPVLDLYVQDMESGWTALHRALYFGNIAIARALMDRDLQDADQHLNTSPSHGAGGLIKIKDREGNSPFDVYGASITKRTLHRGPHLPLLGGGVDDEDVENELAQGVTGDAEDDSNSRRILDPRVNIGGDQMFAFGSNKNFTLGFGDEDDRQFPESIFLMRPEQLLRHFFNEAEAHGTRLKCSPSKDGRASPAQTHRLPAIIRHRPITIQDVQLSKMHSAVLTGDPEANLYMCGFGTGGRLGTGDEATRFGYVNVQGGGLAGKKVIHIALGQNHTVAISSEGEAFTWGNGGYGQLGYTLNNSNMSDEEPKQLLPKQLFGPLKRELVVGASASRIHSVVYTSSSLYTFGKNEGQLGLVDSDARSLDVQHTPRKVAASLFSSPLQMVSAIDKATTCLLESHEVWVFSNYGYTRLSFPMEGFANYFLRSMWGPRSQATGNHIYKVTSGGDTICAMSTRGDVYTVHVSPKIESSVIHASTTNPSKIRGALSKPQPVWSLKKSYMAVRDVDVGQDGSIIICTQSGSVWRRVKRTKIKDATLAGLPEFKAKDYKFSRVPGLTRIAAVRSNTFGAYAAVRRDLDVLQTQVALGTKTLWKDLYPLLPFHGFGDEDSDTENPTPRFWTSTQRDDVASIRRVVLTAPNLEESLAEFLAHREGPEFTYDVMLGTTISDVRIPVHEFVLKARSRTISQALTNFRLAYFFTIPDVMNIEYDGNGKPLILFKGFDFLTIFNLVLFIYSDVVVDVWHHTRHAPASAFRYRQIRSELMKTASHLDMQQLEQAVRVMREPSKTLNRDFEQAITHPGFFDNGDVQIHLDGKSVKVHSALMIQRCPFFEGLFRGRAAGSWLSSRREKMLEGQNTIDVDLKHVNPEIFNYVLRYLYADTDEEIFDCVVTTDLDAFLDFIIEVMSVANELMLDRLAQCCQKVLGRFVNMRNVCQLLNAVSSCSVEQFKEAALEYICLNLEGMLENRLLQELDKDLMLDLNEVVRQNQLACLPVSKSVKVESELVDRYPELIDLMEQSKKIKLDSITLQNRLHDREAKSLGGSKAKAAFYEDFDQPNSSPSAISRSPRDRTSSSKSPSLKTTRSIADLIFDMDEDREADTELSKEQFPARQYPTEVADEDPLLYPGSPKEDDASDRRDHAHPLALTNVAAASISPSSYQSQEYSDPERKPTDSKKPWGAALTTTIKSDLKHIMAQASPSRVSNLSIGLSVHAKSSDTMSSGAVGKLSQRERKQMQQKRLVQHQPSPVLSSSPPTEAYHPNDATSSPWQIASRGPVISLKEVLGAESSETTRSPNCRSQRTPSPMTLRQTVSGKAPIRHASQNGPTPVTSLLGTQKRSVSIPDILKSHTNQKPSRPLRSSSTQTQIQTPPVRHSEPFAEPSLQLTMADILSQQQTEKEVIKEAAAKRSLQEIQEEQAFQEWWDEESRKVKAEEEKAKKSVTAAGRGARGKIRGRGASRSRDRGRGKGAGESGEGSGNKASGNRKACGSEQKS